MLYGSYFPCKSKVYRRVLGIKIREYPRAEQTVRHESRFPHWYSIHIVEPGVVTHNLPAAQLRLPLERARELVLQLDQMSAARTVHTETLRSVLGVWIWGALLRREVLCIPSAIFRMLERYPEQRLAPWASVRRELPLGVSQCALLAPVPPLPFR